MTTAPIVVVITVATAAIVDIRKQFIQTRDLLIAWIIILITFQRDFLFIFSF